MSKSIVAVDPGTSHTGYVKLEAGDDEVSLVGFGKPPLSRSAAPQRINEILNYIVEVLWKTPTSSELWVELFAPYGARRGMMWNASLVGALCYLPVTRRDEGLISYGVYPVQWREWVRTEIECGKGPIDRVRAEDLFSLYGVDYTEELAKEAHLRDALCIGLFGLYGAEEHEYEISEAIN